MKHPFYLVFALILLFTSCSDSESDIVEDEVIVDPGKSRAIVLKFGWDIPVIRALNNSDFITEVNESPYDGLIFSAQSASRYAFHGNKLEQNVIDETFAAMTPNTFSRPMHHFVKLHVDKIEGGFNGDNLDTFVDNVKRFAKAAKASGFKGIAFDNEDYWGDPWKWFENINANDGACPGLTRAECAQATYDAGYKMMEAILSEWSDVEFMPLFGAWLRDEAAWDHILQYSPGNKWYNPNSVEAEFLVGAYGAINAKGNVAKFIDGGELYGLSKREDFRAIADYLRDDFSLESDLFPQALKQPYADNVQIGFGIYDFRDGLFGIPPLNINQFGTMIENGIQEADYIWIYTELHDWWKEDGNFYPQQYAPQEWFERVESILQD